MNQPRVAVTGGAGFVGSHSVLGFGERGWHVTVIDNLSSGHAEFAKLADTFEHVDLLDADALDDVFARGRFDGVLHCAALAEVAASVADPLWYHRHNLTTTMNLVASIRRHGNAPIVFSSSAAVYGAAQTVPIYEDHPRAPINPYGFTKLACEELLAACESAYQLRSVCLRYFNAAGSDPLLRTGERHSPETHAIPNILRAASDATFRFQLFGTDYPTRDGTCVRDYIHVADLAEAHARALEYLWRGGVSRAINVGSGDGTSVRELVGAVTAATETSIPVDEVGRRDGDPPSLVAAIELAGEVLGWHPVRSDIVTVVADAWRWRRRELGLVAR